MNLRSSKYLSPDGFELYSIQRDAEIKATEGKLSIAEFEEDKKEIDRLQRKLKKLKQ